MSVAPEEQPRRLLETDSAVQAEYIMWPRTNLSPEEIERTDSALRQIVGPEVALEKRNAGLPEHAFLLFWLGPLSEGQVVEIEKLDRVGQPSCATDEFLRREH